MWSNGLFLLEEVMVVQNRKEIRNLVKWVDFIFRALLFEKAVVIVFVETGVQRI